MLARTLSLALAALLTATLGCFGEKPQLGQATIDAARAQLILAEEPTGAVTPLDLREQEGGFQPGHVVLVGQIGGVPNPWKGIETNFPWRSGEATFFLVDPGTAAEFADHSADDPDHAENCPFCARRAEDSANAVAVVTFLDQQGEPYAADAEQLLTLKKGATVVVSGLAKLVGETKTLVVEADGLYLRE